MDKSSIRVLNWDVLLHITTFLERPDISRLSKSCRTFHAVALRQLFHGPIDLRADNLLSFYACLTGDTAPWRAMLVKELRINCSLSRPRPQREDTQGQGGQDSTAQTLTAILRSTRRLKKLELDWAAAGLSSYLRGAVSALANLEELRIPFVSQSLWDDIRVLRAPLRKVSMQFGPMQGYSVADPVPLLDRFASTLEEVSLANVQFKDASTQYSRVRELALSDCYSDFLLGGIDATPAIYAFPNVEELSFSAACVHPEVSQWLEGRSCDKPELIERCRRANKHGLKETGGWQRLQRVSVGHVVDLYMLGLGGPVPHVEIGMLSESTIHMLQDVIRDTSPSTLALSLFPTDRVLDRIPRLFAACDATDGLSHLALTLRVTKPAVDTDRLITNLSALLSPLRVERLTVHLQRWDTVGIYYLPEEDLRPIDACLDRIYEDANNIAGRLFQGASSLREVCMRVGSRELKIQVPPARSSAR